MNSYKNKAGFSLAELIVVVAVLLILIIVAVPSTLNHIDTAKLTADQAAVKILNNATSGYKLDISYSDPFKDESESSDDLMQILANEGYLSGIVIPQTENAVFTWDYKLQIWQMYINETPVALSPLGSTFEEISSNMISIISQGYEINNHYGRTWGDYAYTDIGLDPQDWKYPVLHIYYKPSGANLKICPEEGYSFEVYDFSGEKLTLKSSYGWYLIYNDVNKKWYYHTISTGNEIDITTLAVTY
jgi:prepilin-type N-terminal cleavage/methylation domain-containing protein